MTLDEFYTKIGGSVGDVLQRLPSEGMIKKFLPKFKDDPSYASLKASLEEGNLDGAFLAIHTLKGVAQNLGFSDLAEAASALTERLRSKTVLPEKELVDEVDRCYGDVMALIDEVG